jgi:hypothetical protein
MLPAFNERGDLPVGIHPAAWHEIESRLSGGVVRQRLFRTLRHVHALAARAGHLERFLVFGSFVTAKEAPGDLDIVLVMADAFVLEAAPRESRVLFSHADADARFGASVFWVRRGLLPDVEMAGFLEFWQTRRDGAKRGIVEVVP